MITAEGLSAIRGERLVFAGVAFSLGRGQALVLTGPNGAGKSTLLRMMAGLSRPAAGRLLWDREDIFADPVEHGRRVALLGHQDALKPALTAAENLAFAAALTGRPVARALAALGLADLANVPARMLSSGQKRRLALARVSLLDAPLWLLDEPTLGLDDRAIGLLGALLSGHLAKGGMIAAATHVTLPLADVIGLRLDGT